MWREYNYLYKLWLFFWFLKKKKKVLNNITVYKCKTKYMWQLNMAGLIIVVLVKPNTYYMYFKESSKKILLIT